MVFFPRRLCNVPYNTVENLYNHTMERECSWGFNLDSVPLTCALYDQKILPFWMILPRDWIRVSQIPSAMEGFLVNEQSQHWWLACTSRFPMLFVSVTWCTLSLLASHFWLFHVPSGNPASSEHMRLSASARSGDWHTCQAAVSRRSKAPWVTKTSLQAEPRRAPAPALPLLAGTEADLLSVTKRNIGFQKMSVHVITPPWQLEHV